ncbi:MAG TPA: hypothetical protein VLK85_21555 [Ramlibacter sp.]|nr:hypothetical protein [Ramlibacter sp.]
MDVPETQIDWALSRIGPVLPLLCANRGLCIEPVICRSADLSAISPHQMERQMRSSACTSHQRGHLLPIGIVSHSSPAYIAKSYLRYVAFQCLGTAEQRRLTVDRLREVLRAAVALALLDWLGLDLSVRVGEPQDYVAMVRD